MKYLLKNLSSHLYWWFNKPIITQADLYTYLKQYNVKPSDWKIIQTIPTNGSNKSIVISHHISKQILVTLQYFNYTDQLIIYVYNDNIPEKYKEKSHHCNRVTTIKAKDSPFYDEIMNLKLKNYCNDLIKQING